MHSHQLLLRIPPLPSSSSHARIDILRRTFFSCHPLASPTRSWPIRAQPELQRGGVVLVGGEEEPIGGPIELPPSSSTSTIFATTDEPTPLQLSTSVLLTGAISVFLFRSLRRRANRAKELRVRSTGVKGAKDVKEALETLKAMSRASLDTQKPPSAVQTFLGGLAAGAVAIILYKFATTVEASLNRQTISDNFSVRQITITIRTIINGLCYLATFIFGINSIGLLLYSGQLAISSFMEPESNQVSDEKDDEALNKVSSSTGTIDNVERPNSDGQK